MVALILSWILTQATNFERLFLGPDKRWSLYRILAGAAFFKLLVSTPSWALVCFILGVLILDMIQNNKK